MASETVDDLINKISLENPASSFLISQVASLITSYPPSFIYINDPTNPRISSLALRSLLEGCSKLSTGESSRVRFAHVNAVACFTARVFYDTALNALADFQPSWEEGSENWNRADGNGGGVGMRWNDSVDGFVHGLRAVHADAVDMGRDKGKGMNGGVDVQMVLVVERAERLKETLPDLLVPLTRLAELSQVPITVILLSEVRWQDIKPPLGASPTPYHIDVAVPSKEAVLSQLMLSFRRTSSSTSADDNPYNPALLPLYTHFASVLYSICAPFTNDPHELAYISAARWPGFVQPVIDDHRLNVQEQRESGVDIEPALAPPSEDMRMRLTRLFTPSLTTALETLYPRLKDATSWARDNAPLPNLLDLPAAAPTSPRKPGAKSGAETVVVVPDVLPRMSKFILIAAFLASTNPAKTDLRMFGRGLDERRRKKKGGGVRRTGKNTVSKVPQRLLGPAPFPLDRLNAILGVLLEENDVDTRPHAPQFTIPGEYTDMEITRVHIHGAIMELTRSRLLHRTTPADRLDGPPMLKCGVSYDVALALARDLAVPLNDLMCDPA
ncbi:hypothetical protein FIBSPDRAFT_859838 [Athelia psychrophila]|uniref:Origin recognition complex subunit 5 n=1 Tax=Athelia psychrophila TaxID=1759441 RepID=A0A166KU95_9AGAM|nr:hypothetical protein FIBSPDRAFT_859838 [Fibularhizoctonia sp. CBS 109695]